MGLVELVFLAVSLAMDAFAVAICQGLGMRRIRWGQALVIALFFGGFQALMPFLGWLLGSAFAQYIASFDHWIAFGLLVFIGGKMLWDTFHEPDAEAADGQAHLKLGTLLLLAIATSIDALAAGLTFAFLNVAIGPAVALIGLITFALSFIGVVVGNQFGSRFEKPATAIGGIVLILIGCKVLGEHLGFW